MAGERLLPGFHGDQIISRIPGQEVKIVDEDPAMHFISLHCLLPAPRRTMYLQNSIKVPGRAFNYKATGSKRTGAIISLPELLAVNAQTPW